MQNGYSDFEVSCRHWDSAIWYNIIQQRGEVSPLLWES